MRAFKKNHDPLKLDVPQASPLENILSHGNEFPSYLLTSKEGDML